MAPRTSGSNLSRSFVQGEEEIKEAGKEMTYNEKMVEEEEKEEEGKNALRHTLEAMSLNKSQVNLVNFKLPLGLTVKRARSSQGNNEGESKAKRVKIQNEGQELVVNCDIGRPRCLLCRLNMVSPEALRYHNLMRHTDLAPIHTLVSPSKATASAPTSPIRKLSITSPVHHKRLSLPNMVEARVPMKRVRVKVMKEVEIVKDVGRAAPEERLTESPKKEKVPLRKASLEEARSDDSGLLTEEGFLEDLLDGVVDIKQEKLSLPELLKRILDHLAVLDKSGMFKEPVDLEEAPDYLSCISHPMDFSTMGKKVEAEEYSSIEAFEEDFLLVVSNCLTYNMEDTKFWRAAKRIKTNGLAVIEEARLGRLRKEPSERKPVSRISKEFKKRKSKEGGMISASPLYLVEDAPKSIIVETKTERKTSESPSDSGVSSTNSTTALDSDNSITSSEFAVPTAPRRKSSRPGGPKRPEIVQPMEGEFTGRRQSQRSYGGEKPFMCNHCPLTFSNNDSKVGHERTHTEKKLECPFCEMRFGSDISLRKHSKIHERQLASETT